MTRWEAKEKSSQNSTLMLGMTYYFWYLHCEIKVIFLKEINIFEFVLYRTYLKAKAKDEGWDPSAVDTWKEEFLCEPRQPNTRSCGIYICMVTYFYNSSSLFNRRVSKCYSVYPHSGSFFSWFHIIYLISTDGPDILWILWCYL